MQDKSKFEATLNKLMELYPLNADLNALTKKQNVKLRRVVDEIIEILRVVSIALDPVQRPQFVFDPSNPVIVGQLIGNTLLAQEKHTIHGLRKFYGSGVYAIPTPDAKDYFAQGPKLAIRLKEHAKSILAAKSTLNINHFDCRFIVVQSGWQRAAEDYLIGKFKPIWNMAICTGFGKHGDSSKTRKNTRSPWDTLHPGRAWATKKGNRPNPMSVECIHNLISEHYSKYKQTA
jgi:hypothetical protein